MNSKRAVATAASVAVLALAGPSAAFENGGFESGFTSWSRQGQTSIKTSVPAQGTKWKVSTLTPFEGDYFAWLATDGSAVGGDYSLISQQFTAEPDEVLTGAYFFGTKDYGSYNDVGTVKLIPASGSGLSAITLAMMDVATVGDYSSMSDWGVYSHTFTLADAGTYSLCYRIEDVKDTLVASYLGADGIKLVPEPATLCLLALGSVAMFRRRRHA